MLVTAGVVVVVLGMVALLVHSGAADAGVSGGAAGEAVEGAPELQTPRAQQLYSRHGAMGPVSSASSEVPHLSGKATTRRQSCWVQLQDASLGAKGPKPSV